MTQPISRRQMIVTSSSGIGASLLFSRSLPAAMNIDPITFAIVSDTHLGRKDSKSPETNWRQAIAEINQLNAEFVLHLGDVVDSARETQYPIYAETRKLLKKPIHEIPGNHDSIEQFTKYIAEKTDRSFDHGGIRFVLFNNANRESHDGFITADQNAWLADQCARAAKEDLRVILCCHVPIHTNKHPDRGWYVKPDHGQKEFYATLKQHSDRVLACLHGHFHNGIRGWRDHGQTVEVLCPSVIYNQNRNLTEHLAAGKAEGFFVDELRPGYLIAQVGNGKLSLQYKVLGENAVAEFAVTWD